MTIVSLPATQVTLQSVLLNVHQDIARALDNKSLKYCQPYHKHMARLGKRHFGKVAASPQDNLPVNIFSPNIVLLSASL